MKHLSLDTSPSDKLSSLKVGDVISVSGVLYTCRDKASRKILHDFIKKGKTQYLPFDLTNGVVFHAGPIVAKSDGWRIVSIGSTTSDRLDYPSREFIVEFGLKAIIGKGGMSQGIANVMKEKNCVYLATCGGISAILTRGVQRVLDVFWLEELGEAEAVWKLQVKEFGPLIVGIDANGNNIFTEVEERVRKKQRR
jgi:fumarate hydratase subunit beta